MYPLFISRDLTRRDLRELVTRGLAAARGNYRELVRLFGMPDQDYKRLLNFLVRHACAVDYRPYRRAATAACGASPGAPASSLGSGAGLIPYERTTGTRDGRVLHA